MYEFSEADRDGKPRTPIEEGRDVSTFPGSEEGPSMQPCRKARSDDKYLNFAPGGFHVGKPSFKMLYAQLRELTVQLRELVRKFSQPGHDQKKKLITWCRWA